MIRPYCALNYWQADQIAERLGVLEDTYQELWSKCVPLYDGKYRNEVPGEFCHDLVSTGGWDLLSDEAKADVNDAIWWDCFICYRHCLRCQ
jgi:hypothetical protein